jgi:hypothetical protein
VNWVSSSPCIQHPFNAEITIIIIEIYKKTNWYITAKPVSYEQREDEEDPSFFRLCQLEIEKKSFLSQTSMCEQQALRTHKHRHTHWTLFSNANTEHHVVHFLKKLNFLSKGEKNNNHQTLPRNKNSQISAQRHIFTHHTGLVFSRQERDEHHSSFLRIFFFFAQFWRAGFMQLPTLLLCLPVACSEGLATVHTSFVLCMSH